MERLSFLESLHLLRQGLDVRSLAAERPARRRKDDGNLADPDGENDGQEADPSVAAAPEVSRPPDDGG